MLTALCLSPFALVVLSVAVEAACRIYNLLTTGDY